MPPFVSLLIVWNMDFPVALGRNDRFGAAFLQGLAQLISIKGLVGHQCLERQVINQIWHTDDLTALAGKQFEPHKIAERVGEGQDFGGQSTF